MKISELIKKLQYVLEKNKDMEVSISIDTENKNNLDSSPKDIPTLFSTTNINIQELNTEGSEWEFVIKNWM